MKLIQQLFITIILASMAACGGDGNNTEEITVAYVDNVVNGWSRPGDPMTSNGTIMIHDDGYQGSNIDIGRIILSKFNRSSFGDVPLFAFSFQLSITPTDGTFAAFYMDLDGNSGTGMPVNGTGADGVFLNSHSFDRDGSGAISFNNYHVWSDSLSSWTPVTQSISSSKASYYEGSSIDNAVIATNNNGLAGLLGSTGVKGVFKIQTLPTGDPNTVTSTLDSTSVFTFDFPQ